MAFPDGLAETDSSCEDLKIFSQETFAEIQKCLFQDSAAEYTKIIDHPGTYKYSSEDGESSTKCEISLNTVMPSRYITAQQSGLLSQQSQGSHSLFPQFSAFGGQVPEDQHMAFADPPATLQRPPSSLSPSPMSLIPSTQPFPGAINFQFEFGKQPKDTKSAAWTYSSVTNKLYAQKDLSCPIRFKIDADGVANQLFVRALPVYSKPEYLQEVVKRCPNHIQAPESANIPHREHFIWCENQGASYIKDPHTGRYAVRVPYDAPPAGTSWVTFLYSFKCLNSCVGGPNRREMSIVYTLENANQEVLGRACIDLRICACPGRDRKSDESKAENRNQSAASTPTASTHTDAPSHPPPPTNTNAGGQVVHERDFLVVNKRPRVEPTCEVFTLTVKGRRNFELLSKIRDSLEMTEQLVPDTERDRFTQRRRHNDAQYQVSQQQQPPTQPPPVTRLPQLSSAFNFSSARPFAIKQDVVDSTQRGNLEMTNNAMAVGRGYDMTDGASTSPSVAEWLRKIGLNAYVDNFHNAGLYSMEQLKSERNFTIKDLENMQLTKPTVSQIWNSLKGYRLDTNPAASREANTSETVSLPDSQGNSSQETAGSQSQNSVVSLGSSGVFTPPFVEFTRCSIKLTVTSKGNKKRSAESSTSEAESSSNEEYQSKKHRALKRDSNSQ